MTKPRVAQQWVPLSSIMEKIANGEIWNSGTLVALLYVLAERGQRPAS